MEPGHHDPGAHPGGRGQAGHPRQARGQPPLMPPARWGRNSGTNVPTCRPSRAPALPPCSGAGGTSGSCTTPRGTRGRDADAGPAACLGAPATPCGAPATRGQPGGRPARRCSREHDGGRPQGARGSAPAGHQGRGIPAAHDAHRPRQGCRGADRPHARGRPGDQGGVQATHRLDPGVGHHRTAGPI